MVTLESEKRFDILTNKILLTRTSVSKEIVDIRDSETGEIVLGRLVSFSSKELFERIVQYWNSNFQNGIYPVPEDPGELRYFKVKCHNLGVKTTFGTYFNDAYKAYIATVANQLYQSPRSIGTLLRSKATTVPSTHATPREALSNGIDNVEVH